MARQTKDRTISIRLSQKMVEALDQYALVEDLDRTQVIRDAIAQKLKFPIDPVDKRMSFLEDRIEDVNEQLTERIDDLADKISRCLEFLEKTH